MPTDSIGILAPLRRVAKLLADDRRRTLKLLGADEATLDLLSTLRRAGSPYRLTTREIAERSLVTAGAISQRLGRAESAGLITRTPTNVSRRGVMVTLTAAGHEVIEYVVRALLEHEADFVTGLTVEQRAEFLRALQIIGERGNAGDRLH